MFKYSAKLFIPVLFLLFSGTTGWAQPDFIGNNPKLPQHPRILFLEGEEAAIRQSIVSDKNWDSVNRQIISWCDTLLGKSPVERIKTGMRLLGPARECLLRVNYLSYAWRMTNEQKYFQRAEQEMLAAASFSDWNPSHFLDVAEFTMALAIGYDWLYNELPENSRSAIREAIIKKGIEPSLNPKYNWWLESPENWNQVCNAGMTLGALAVYEDEPELAKQIINRAVQSISLPMQSYNPDGAYYEGYSYWGYGTTFNVLFLSTIEKNFKTDFGLLKNEGFLKTTGYLLNMEGVTGKAFNYSDNSTTPELHPAMFWLANRLQNPSLLWNEKKLIPPAPASRNKFLPMLMIWGSGTDLNKISSPKEKMWVGNGKNPVVLMRTSWNDPDAIFVGVKCGSSSLGHSHMDIGSFVMEADGVRWAMDFGAQDYNSLESKGIDLWSRKQESQRWQVFRYNNFVHNTLTVNNEFQLVGGSAPITGSSSKKSFMNATTDLSEIYKGQLKKAERGIAIADEKYVVVRDEIETPEKETTIRWTLLTSADVKITGGDSAELTKDGKKLFIQVQEPAGIEMKTWTTQSDNDYDAPNPGTTLVGFEVKLPPKTKGAFTVYLVPEKVAGKVTKEIKFLQEWN